jgi:hypothetical protein
MMKTNILFLFCIIAFSAFAQQSIPENVPTPNAASLGHYGDIPVSYYTGNPGISIPLYEMTVRGVTLPIKLDYDASGVQMNVLPSWTGYNWTLSAGGAITRKINGSADEWKQPTMIPPARPFHRYFDCFGLLPTLNNQDLANSISGLAIYDFEPDVFYFNFMGKSGKFFLGNDGQWKVNSDFDIDVIFNIHDTDNYLPPFICRYPRRDAADPYQPKTIAGFRLRDTDGITYEFGYTTNAIEYTIDFTKMGNLEDSVSWLATSWYLTRVTDRLGNVLYQLTYERGPFFAQPFRCYEADSCLERGKDMHGLMVTYTYEESYEETNFSFPYSIQLSAPIYLKKIEAANGVSLGFNRINSPQTMESLYENSSTLLPASDWFNVIKNHVEHYIGDSAFYYIQSENFSNYHKSGASYNNKADLFSKMVLQCLNTMSITDHYEQNVIKFIYNTNERMHLTKLEKCYYHNGGPRSYAAYSFFYNNFDQLPLSCLTVHHDHWGYYNGLGCGDGQHDANFIMQRNNPDAAKMKYGSLTKIIYPTGGTSIIEYEPNNYSQILSLNRQSLSSGFGIGGGLRVKSITEYEDSTCSVMLKRRFYTYTNPSTGSSSGQLFAKPVYGWNDWVARNDDDAEVTISTVRSASIVPLSNSFGPAVGYSWVTETFEDNSSILYHYHNLSDGPMDILQSDIPFNSSGPSPYDKFTEHGYKRGKLLSTTMKDSIGNKVSSSTYQYRSTGMADDGTEVSNLSLRRGRFGGTYSFKGRKYKLYYQRCDLASRNDTLFYGDGRWSVDAENYGYCDYLINMTYPYNHVSSARMLCQKSKQRGSSIHAEYYHYPMDSVFASLMSLATGSYYLPILSKDVYYNNTLIEKTEWQYGDFTVNNKTQKLLNTILLTRQGNTEVVLSNISYTSTGQIKNYKKIDEPNTWLTWALNDNYLVIKNLGNGPVVNSPIGNNLVFNRDYFLQEMNNRCGMGYLGLFTGYSYFDHNGISSSTNQRGITTFYDYNKAHQLESVRDDNSQLLKTFEYNFKNK